MKLTDIIEKLQQLKNTYGDVEVKIDEVKNGPNASDRYGIGMGLIVGDLEIEELQNYISTGCYY